MKKNIEILDDSKQPDSASMMTVKEMAVYLHSSLSTARKIIRRGFVRYQRMGKRYVVPAADVHAYLDSNWRREGVALEEMHHRKAHHREDAAP